MIPARVSDPTVIDEAQIAENVKAGRRPILQFSGRSSYPPVLLAAVNQACARFGDRLDVRFYAHYGDSFEAAVLERLPEVRSLSVDSLTAIDNSDAIARLPHLTRLSFGVFEFDQPSFLAGLDLGRFTRLVLANSRKRNFDLAPLAAARRLTELFLNGHAKNITAISALPALSKVSLAGMPHSRDLAFLGDLASLRSLSLILGSRASIDEFKHRGLTELEILRVRGLQGLGALRRFPRLEDLRVEDQAHVASLDLAGVALERLVLDNCKTLAALDGLETQSRLVGLWASRTRLDLDALVDRAWPTSLEVLALYS